MPMRKSSRYTRSGLNKTEKKQTKAIVKRAINSAIETKSFYRTRLTDYEITNSAPFVTDLLNIPQGTAENQRLGDEFVFKHLKINLDVTGSVDGTVKSGLPVDRVRVLLVKWKESDYINGAVNEPSFLRIFGTNQLPLGSNLYTAMVNHEENGRSFKVLYDKKITLSGQKETTHINSPEFKQRHISINVNEKKYGHKKVRYDSISPTTNAHMNGLFLMVVTDNVGGALQSGPTISMDSRLLFKDA